MWRCCEGCKATKDEVGGGLGSSSTIKDACSSFDKRWQQQQQRQLCTCFQHRIMVLEGLSIEQKPRSGRTKFRNVNIPHLRFFGGHVHSFNHHVDCV